MTSVSQLIPNFIQGINAQPDELKKPGQIRDAVNVYPDVVTGLTKRTGYKSIERNLPVNGKGTWFVMRKRNLEGVYEQFIFNISLSGYVRGWRASDGLEQRIFNTDNPINFDNLNEIEPNADKPQLFYFRHTDNLKLRTATGEDTVFISNPNIVVENSNVTQNIRPYEAFIEFTTLDVSRSYSVNIDIVGTDEVTNTIASRITQIDTSRFFQYGAIINDDDEGGIDKGQCVMLGSYTVESDRTVTGKVRASPIILRVTIAGIVGNLDGNGSQDNCNYYVQETRLLSGGSGWKENDQFEVSLPDKLSQQSGGDPMKIKYEVEDVSRLTGSLDYVNISVANPDAGSALTILEELAEEIKTTLSADDRTIKTKIIGNGIYLEADYPFRVDTSEKDIINILSSFSEFDNDWETQKEKDIEANEELKTDLQYQYPNPYAVVNNVSDLPLECKIGFLVKVENSFTDDDDYYVQFKRATKDEGLADSNSESGVGYWEEVAKPGESTGFKRNTMPHVLVYQERREEPGRWFIGRVKWAERSVGTYDQFTPSFLKYPLGKINNIMFYRNRLMFLSRSAVVTSQAGDYTNFFAGTALTTSPSDPIDIEASSEFSPNLSAGIQINNAMLLFSEYSQFLLTTDSDIFSPSTVKINKISSYQFDTQTEPFMLGTNVGFIGKSRNNSILYEMTNVFREGQADVIERSKVVSDLIESDYTLADSSRDDGLIILGKFGNRKLWVHKYFKENSQTDIQQAWVKWDLDTYESNPNVSGVVFHFMEQGKHFLITRGRLENGTQVCHISLNEFTEDKFTDDFGPSGSSISYNMRIVLPTFYVMKSEQQSYKADTTGSLILHRMHLNTGATNFYDVTIKRYGKDDYVVRYEQSIQDDFDASGGAGDVLEEPIFEPITYNREETVPIYERNTNVNIIIESDYDSPFTLYSLRWEGDYTNRYYQRV